MDTTNSSSNKRIAKNTLMLYLRMFMVMGVSLYTSRIVLKQLGVADYGVYNVVGGVVTMLSFFNNSMATATRRFIAFAIGRNDSELELNTFKISLLIQIIIALALVVLAETVGLWFMKNYVVVPEGARAAAIFVYHFSVFTAVLGVLMVPFMSLVTAHENMKAYAYISILEVVLKLSVALSLVAISGQKLEILSVLSLFSALIINVVWLIYCSKNFVSCKIGLYWNKSLFKEMFGFVGWQSIAAFAALLRTQGVNIVLNMFFGPIFNAARGIAVQVNAAALNFVNNFQLATNPQLTKLYAKSEYSEMHQLIYRSSKFCFLLMFVLSAPLLMETRQILELWLGQVPPNSVLFVKLMLISTLIYQFSGIVGYAALSTGKIRNYQIIMSALNGSIIVLVFAGFKFGFPAQSMFYVEMVIYAISLFVRLILVNKMIGLSIKKYLNDVILRNLATSAMTVAICYAISLALPDSTSGFIIGLISAFIVACISSYIVCLTGAERSFVNRMVFKRLPFFNKNKTI